VIRLIHSIDSIVGTNCVRPQNLTSHLLLSYVGSGFHARPMFFYIFSSIYFVGARIARPCCTLIRCWINCHTG